MSLLQELEIPPRARQCCQGGEPFHAGIEYYSLLESNNEDGFTRKDYCLACWAGQSVSKKIFWKSRVPVKNEISPKIIQRNQELLCLLMSKTLEDSQQFVLALFLARNRLLRYLKEIEGTLLYEVIETEEILCIKKIEISTIQVEEIKKALSSKT